jgi:pimeloyl-ACP methyl ester carboxylesterase
MPARQATLPSGIRRIIVDGVSITVEVIRTGAPCGPILAWLHGLGSSSTVGFAAAARHPALAGVTSLLVDLPGHGQSARPADWTYDIEDHAQIVCMVLESVANVPVTLLGHSMGGSIAILCAATASGPVERLILAEPSLDPDFGPLSRHIAAQREPAFRTRGYGALLRVTEREADRGDAGAQAFLPALRLADPVAMHRSATSLRAERSPSLRTQLAHLAATFPTAVITGDRSPPFERLAGDREPKGYVVSQAGHAMMADNPDGFARIVAAAMARRSSPDGRT